MNVDNNQGVTVNKHPIHTSTGGNACVPPGIDGKSAAAGLLTKRFMVCRCNTCNGLTFSSWYESQEDIEGTDKELKQLRKESRDPHVEEFQASDPMPTWCDCRRTKDDSEKKDGSIKEISTVCAQPATTLNNTNPSIGAEQVLIRAFNELKDRIQGVMHFDEVSGTYSIPASEFIDAINIIQDKAPPAQPFQGRVQPWMAACFGPVIAADTIERNHRFLEESLELVQACGATASEAHQLVDYTFSRPIGDRPQEVGGVMVTLAALCLAQSIDMHECGEIELARIWTKVEQIREKQAAKPKHSPLPQAEPVPATSLESQAAQLIAAANASGQVVTIDTVPGTPLAMGNHTMRAAVRPARAMKVPG